MVETSDTFNFELVMPERKLIDGPMWQVVVPGSEGDFGVLVNHSALVSSLRPGVIRIWRSSAENPHEFFISGGFADVTATSCTVLAEEAVELGDLSAPDLEEERKSLEDELALVEEPVGRKIVADRLAVVRAKLEVLAHA